MFPLFRHPREPLAQLYEPLLSFFRTRAKHDKRQTVSIHQYTDDVINTFGVIGRAGLYISVKQVGPSSSYSPESYLTHDIEHKWYSPDLGYGSIQMAVHEH